MNQEDQAYLDAITELGCIACRLDGKGKVPAEVHHPRSGTGLALKAPHKDAVPLCPSHHRGTEHPRVSSIHLAPNHFKSHYGTERELWEMTQQLLKPSQCSDEDY